MKLKRRKVGDGDYEVVNERGEVVARVQEYGNKWYRWHVTPTDRSIRGWDTETISGAIDALRASLS